MRSFGLWLAALVLLAPACLLLKDLGALEGDLADASTSPEAAADDDDAPASDDDDAPDAPHDAGSDAAHDAGSDAETPPPPPGCAGDAGPTPVPLPLLGFCMDRTEVTVSQYREFLTAKAGVTTGQDPRCASNTSFVPSEVFGSGYENQPIRDIDWCDALAYCSWAGKRMCGARGGGGPVAFDDRNDATKDEWFAVCSHNGDGVHTYPYGVDFEPGRCNDRYAAMQRDAGWAPVDVTSMETCQSPDGIYDLSGNIGEYEDDCRDLDGSVECLARGGAWYHDNLSAESCSGFEQGPFTLTPNGWGIRCCSDLNP